MAKQMEQLLFGKRLNTLGLCVLENEKFRGNMMKVLQKHKDGG